MKPKRDWLWPIIIGVVFFIVGVSVLASLSGCQSSTKIEGGKSEAKAVTEEVRPKTTTTTTITITLPKEAK